MQGKRGQALGVADREFHADRATQRKSTEMNAFDIQHIGQINDIGGQVLRRVTLIGNLALPAAAQIHIDHPEKTGIRIRHIDPGAAVLPEAMHQHQRLARALILIKQLQSVRSEMRHADGSSISSSVLDRRRYSAASRLPANHAGLVAA